MLVLILTVLLVFLLLVGSELWWRKRRPNDEFSRKFIHIVVGSLAATWPFYLSWGWIVALGAAFIFVVTVSKYLHIFQAIHAVERPTLGEVFFALAVMLVAFITHQPWIYAVALLHMSLADGFAAIIGVTLGNSTRYKVLGHAKSLAGSGTFLLISLILLLAYGAVTGQHLPLAVVVGLALVATGLENIGVGGLDNLLVPVVIAAALQRL